MQKDKEIPTGDQIAKDLNETPVDNNFDTQQKPQDPIIKQPEAVPISKKIKLSIKLGFVLLILVAIGALSFIYFQNKRVNEEAERIKNEPPKALEIKSVKESDPIVDWETYRNEKYGINFEYPDWINTGTYTIDTTYDLEPIIELNNPEKGGFNTLMSIRFWDNPNSLSLKEYDEEVIVSQVNTNQLHQPDAIETNIGNKIAYYDKTGNCSPHLCEQYVIPVQGGIIEINVFENSANSTILEILSTFQFTN